MRVRALLSGPAAIVGLSSLLSLSTLIVSNSVPVEWYGVESSGSSDGVSGLGFPVAFLGLGSAVRDLPVRFFPGAFLFNAALWLPVAALGGALGLGLRWLFGRWKARRPPTTPHPPGGTGRPVDR